MSEAKSHWSPEEKTAVTDAFAKFTDTEGFLAAVRGSVPDAPHRTIKAYLSYLVRVLPKDGRKSPMYMALLRTNQAEVAATKNPNKAGEKSTDWLEEVSSEPLPPVEPPRPAPASNFIKPPPLKPDPNARVPRHIPTPPASRVAFTAHEMSVALGVPLSVVKNAVSNNHLPHRSSTLDGPFVSRAVFDVLHSALSEGHSFEHACLLAMEKVPQPKPIVPAQHLYAVESNEPEAPESPVEADQLPPPPAEIYVPETGDERVWTLEAIRDGVFTVEQARDILGLKDAARTNWALGLLAAGKITLDQAAKLLR
jgi:hypothetical protein